MKLVVFVNGKICIDQISDYLGKKQDIELCFKPLNVDELSATREELAKNSNSKATRYILYFKEEDDHQLLEHAKLLSEAVGKGKVMVVMLCSRHLQEWGSQVGKICPPSSFFFKLQQELNFC